MVEVFIIKKYFLTLDPSLSLFLLPAALLEGIMTNMFCLNLCL